MANFVAGESFGELSLFAQKTDVTSAHCECDTSLLIFPADEDPDQAAARMDKLFCDYPQIKATILLNLLAGALSGALIPGILRRMNIDPAIAGGVVLTTVTDVIGIIAFIGLATFILVR